MRIIVTRVQPQATLWVQSLRPLHDAVALPLIEVSALPDTSALQAAGQRWADYAAVMFVSSHAVDYFFASNSTLAHVHPVQAAIKTRAWATGPATRAALLAQGVKADLVDSPAPASGQYDSETLWQLVQDQVKPGERVLIVRGNTGGSGAPGDQPDAALDGGQGVGRDWLAQRLQAIGVQVAFVVAYQRGAPAWTQQQCALAEAAAADGSIWLFSSAEALGNLKSLLPATNWTGARAVATHTRIADAARQMGFGVVTESRPTVAAVQASIESMA